MKINEWWKYFNSANGHKPLSQTEKLGAWTMCLLIVVGMFATYLLPKWDFIHPRNTTSPTDDSLAMQWRAFSRHLIKEQAIPDRNRHYPARDTVSHVATATLFPFDPNTASFEELRQLGLSEKVATIIIHYRAKGPIRSPETLERIYSLNKTDYARLKPYITIHRQFAAAEPYSHSGQPHSNTRFYQPFNGTVELNSAGRTELEQIRGIGPGYSERIVTYRSKIGGYIAEEQLREAGLPDTVIARIHPYIHINTEQVKKIHINTATESELNAHPYFQRYAKALIQYRNDIKRFTSTEQLRQLPMMQGKAFKRMQPYAAL